MTSPPRARGGARVLGMSASLGETAYAAYAKSWGHALDTVMPPWRVLTPGVQSAWEASANAVAHDCARSFIAGLTAGASGVVSKADLRRGHEVLGRILESDKAGQTMT